MLKEPTNSDRGGHRESAVDLAVMLVVVTILSLSQTTFIVEDIGRASDPTPEQSGDSLLIIAGLMVLSLVVITVLVSTFHGGERRRRGGAV